MEQIRLESYIMYQKKPQIHNFYKQIARFGRYRKNLKDHQKEDQKLHHQNTTQQTRQNYQKTMTKGRLLLKPVSPNDVEIKGIIFDMDGTLCLPQSWMFPAMREAIGLKDKNIDILKYIDLLPLESQQEAHDALATVEKKAMNEMEPQPGLEELMTFLEKINLRRAILTRNLITPVNHLLENFIPSHVDIHPIITRSFLPPKPKPEPIWHIANDHWDGVDTKHLIMVGDSMDDMRSGRSAGAFTVMIKTHANVPIRDRLEVDYVIDTLDELIDLLQTGLVSKNI